MNNLTNYHSHSPFCDGRASMDEFVREAVRQGFSAYGFSSHAPLPFDTRWTMRFEDMEAYLAEASRLKQIYADQIELYVGLEIDYLNETHHPAIDYFQQLPLDFRIGSVHMLYDSRGEVVDIDLRPEPFAEVMDSRFGGDLPWVVDRYFDRLTRMVELGGFDLVGHPDKLSYNASVYTPGVLAESWYRDRVRNLFETIATRGMMVEVNTKTFERNGFFYPNFEHFKWLFELKIPVVVNADAHDPGLINSGRLEALASLRQAGFRTVWELHENRWQEVPIIEM